MNAMRLNKEAAGFSRASTTKRRDSRRKFLQKKEMKKLMHIVPNLQRRKPVKSPSISRIEVIEETIKYIIQLHDEICKKIFNADIVERLDATENYPYTSIESFSDENKNNAENLYSEDAALIQNTRAVPPRAYKLLDPPFISLSYIRI